MAAHQETDLKTERHTVDLRALFVPETGVTVSTAPTTIHDFWGFPENFIRCNIQRPAMQDSTSKAAGPAQAQRVRAMDISIQGDCALCSDQRQRKTGGKDRVARAPDARRHPETKDARFA
jgi:hypothetical protein